MIEIRGNNLSLVVSELLSREYWENGEPECVPNALYYNTDGSKSNEDVGTVIYGIDDNKPVSLLPFSKQR